MCVARTPAPLFLLFFFGYPPTPPSPTALCGGGGEALHAPSSRRAGRPRTASAALRRLRTRSGTALASPPDVEPASFTIRCSPAPVPAPAPAAGARPRARVPGALVMRRCGNAADRQRRRCWLRERSPRPRWRGPSASTSGPSRFPVRPPTPPQTVRRWRRWRRWRWWGARLGWRRRRVARSGCVERVRAANLDRTAVSVLIGFLGNPPIPKTALRDGQGKNTAAVFHVCAKV